MSTPYLTDYIPPVPILTVRFRRVAEFEATQEYPAIIDTGADMSVAPESILLDLQAHAIQESRLVTQWGEAHPVTLYLVDLEIAGQLLPGVLIAGDESIEEEVVLGRNVLNLLPLFLDGPKQRTYILNDVSVQRLRKNNP